MTAGSVDRSTLRLSEVARHVVIPERIVDTLWFEVSDRCAEWGDQFDTWQDGMGQAMLGLREDDLFAATVGGVAMSIPRQVAKTFIVGRVCMALCSIYPGMTILWTAHRIRTATNTFQKLRALALKPKVRKYIEPGRNLGTAIRDANGEQEIPFRNGSRILFGAREQGFGRGFDEVDVEVFDEAQILTIRALEDMVAATNQSRFPHGALLFYMCTPPRPIDPGEAVQARRAKALEVKSGRPDFSEPVASGDAMYVECSADSDVGGDDGPSLDDRSQVLLANPSYPHRTPEISIARLRENMPDDDAWRREGLGVWDDAKLVKRAVDPEAWKALCVPTALPEWPLAAIGLDMDLSGRLWTSPAAHAGETGTHLEVIPENLLAAGQDAAVAWLWERCKRRFPVVMPAESGARVLQAPLLAKGMKVYALNAPEIAQMSASLAQGVKDKTISHLADELLQAAVDASERADGKTGQWRIKRAGEANGAPLLAVAAAHFGATKWSKRRTGERRGRQSRKAVRS